MMPSERTGKRYNDTGSATHRTKNYHWAFVSLAGAVLFGADIHTQGAPPNLAFMVQDPFLSFLHTLLYRIPVIEILVRHRPLQFFAGS